MNSCYVTRRGTNGTHETIIDNQRHPRHLGVDVVGAGVDGGGGIGMRYRITIPTHEIGRIVQRKMFEKGYGFNFLNCSTDNEFTDFLLTPYVLYLGSAGKLYWGDVNRIDPEYKELTITDLWNLPEIKREPQVWRPKKKEQYWFIDSKGEVGTFQNDGDAFDNDCISAFNTWRTEEQAKKVAAAQDNVQLELRKKMALEFAREDAK